MHSPRQIQEEQLSSQDTFTLSAAVLTDEQRIILYEHTPSSLRAVTNSIVDDDLQPGISRRWQCSEACVVGVKLAYQSWTKSKGTITVHKALMTLGGRLVAKLKWSVVLDEIARVETERAEITVYCSIIRTVLRGGDAAAYGAWNLFALLSAFCCHVGPKDELYCLSDFVTTLRKQFESEKSRAFTHHFKSVRQLEPMHDTISSSSIPFLDDEIQVPPSPLNVRAE